MGHQAGSEEILADQLDGDRVSGNMETQQDLRIDLPRLIQALRRSLPENDPAPADLIQVLGGFKEYHARLADWIDLHGHLNEILFNFGSFFREIERLSASHEDPEPPAIGMHWRPISQRVSLLLDWASAPRRVDETEPFARLEDRIVGPLWAIQLCVASDRLDDLLRSDGSARLFALPRDSRPYRPSYIDINELLDAASEFHDIAERALYLADRRLRETSAELRSFSNTVLSGLEEQ
jgi:hypothetical protein